jgi:hypothetical protein
MPPILAPSKASQDIRITDPQCVYSNMECRFCQKSFSKGEHLRVLASKSNIQVKTTDKVRRDTNAVVCELWIVPIGLLSTNQ